MMRMMMWILGLLVVASGAMAQPVGVSVMDGLQAPSSGTVVFHAGNESEQATVFNRGETIRIETLLTADKSPDGKALRSYAFCTPNCTDESQRTEEIAMKQTGFGWSYQEFLVVPIDAQDGQLKYVVWHQVGARLLAEGNASISTTFSVSNVTNHKSPSSDAASEGKNGVPGFEASGVVAAIVVTIGLAWRRRA